MAQNLLLTSLSAVDTDLPVRYITVQSGNGLAYADVILDAEAGIKTVLSAYEIDEVIVIGAAGSYDEEDLDSPDSAYGLLCSRIARFKDGSIQNEDNLPEDIREKPEAYSGLTILPSNKDTGLRLIPETEFEDSGQWVDNLMEMGKSITGDIEDINLYVTLNSDDAADTFVVLNMLDILISMPESGVKLEKIFTVRSPQKHRAGIVRDDTEGFGVTELFHAIRAFLNYGRADMVVDIWKKSGESNESIESMVYAMRDVDVGLSMCNMPEVERGMLRLRELFRSEQFWRESGYYGVLFSLIAESIREDYGVLMEGEGDLNFIEMVKWAYRHQFYQQTLTLIEARTPENLVNSGIFYYCDSEEHRDRVLQLLAEQRLRLRPYEYYKMDYIDHYFIKSYDRYKTRRRGRGKDPQQVYADLRIESIGSRDPSQITGFTECDSLDTLRDVLFAYYRIGYVRNKISHAESGAMEEKNMEASGDGEISALKWMTDSIELFINSYEKADAEVQDKNPNIIIITGEDVREIAESMRQDSDRFKHKHGREPRSDQEA